MGGKCEREPGDPPRAEIGEAEHPMVKQCSVYPCVLVSVCVCILACSSVDGWVRLDERPGLCVSRATAGATLFLEARGPGQATTPEHTNTAMTMTMATMTLVCDVL